MSITIKPREWLLALWANGTFTVEAEDAPCWQRPAPPEMARAVAALPVEATIASLRARVAELEAALANERKHAAFGARAFEAFWCDGEPGDLDAGDLQRMALDCGLLRHVDASDGPGPHCEWCEDDMGAGDECSCLKPTTARRAKEAADE